MTNKEESRPTGEMGGNPTTPTARNHTAHTAGQPGDARVIALLDWRDAARLTETGLTNVDRALTFTGLAAQIRELVTR